MRGFIAWLVDHATTVFLAVLCLFIAGMSAYIDLPRESNPDITIPVVLVSTPYIGVSPEDVEGLITIPLENELAGLRDVKKMESTSAEGVSIVSITFEPDVVIQDALQKVRDAVSKAKPKLPEDSEEPQISEISFNDIPIVLVTIAGDVDEAVLKDLADDLEEKATRVPGVLDASVSGGVEREIRVEVEPERLAHYSLALYDVTNAIRDENINIPGGTVSTGGSNVLLRVPGEFKSVKEIESVAIKRVGDRPVFVRDIGRVVDGTAERKTFSRMNGRPSVTLSVTKRAGANILEVAGAIKQLAAETDWPEGVEFRVLGDQSENIEISVTDLQNNIITALLLVVAVIIFFMGPRNSLFVAVAIPMSMLMSFLVLSAFGFTLNMVVLFSLMIALGMLVDNAIVVVENVYRHGEMGKSNREAAIEGTREVAIAVGASTLTTVAAFFPMVFWPGIMGEFMSFLPKTVIIVLTASLVVAIGVLPVFMNRWLVTPASNRDPDDESTDPGVEPEPELGRIMSAYKAVLEWSIRWRYLSFASGVFALVVTFALYIGGLNHGVEMFPDTEPERGNVFVRAGEGTELESTDRIVRQIEARLVDIENIDTWVAETGIQSDGTPLGPSSSASNQARITLEFLPSINTAKPGETPRVESTSDTIETLRNELADIAGAQIRVEKELMGPPVGKPIGIEVRGPDFHTVGEVALMVRREIQKIEGVTDLSDDYRVGRPELPFRIDRGAAKRVGISTAGIGDTVRTAVAGAKASSLRQGEDETDIVVRLAGANRGNLQRVLDLRLPGREDTSPNTFAVPLSAVATYGLAGGTGSIKHIDQDLVVTIEGDVREGVNQVDVQALVESKIEAMMSAGTLPDGVFLSMGGSTDEQEEAITFLTNAFLLACALILLVLVTQFDSIWMPLIILVTVALSLIGVLWGLVLTGTPFGIIMTGIGVISLAGVVVNNAIVLLDYVQQLLARGLSVQDALVRAGLTRFRPVMLTAITTTLGLVPMAIGVSVDFMRLRLVFGSVSAQWWGPMAVAVIFGLSFATVLTLVMVPTLYSIYDDFRGLGARIRAWRGRPVAATAASLLVMGLGLSTTAEAVTLENALDAAHVHAPAFRQLDEVTHQTGLQRYKAWSALSPRVSFGASRIINEFPIILDFADSFPTIPGIDIPTTEPTVVQRKAFWTANATVSTRLFSGTALPGLRSTYQAFEAAELNQVQESRQIELGVAQAFYGVMVGREALEVATKNLDAAQGQLELATRRQAAGAGTRRDVLSSQLAVAQAERDVLKADEQRIRAEETLVRWTGLPRDVEVDVTELPPTPATLDDALSSTMNRPDRRALDSQYKAAHLALKASNYQWAPTVDARFQYNYNQNTGFQDDPTSWQLSLVGTWTLWDGGLRVVESAEYKSQRRQVELQRVALDQQVVEQVTSAWKGLQASERALEAVTDELALADENLRLAEQSYKVGAATWLEVRSATLLLASARMSSVQTRMERDLAALTLRMVSGQPLVP